MKNRKKLTIAAAFVAGIIVFIFVQSMMPTQVSGAESLAVKKKFGPMLAFLFGENRVSEYFVRKLAHVIEYSVLGLGVGYLFSLTGKRTTVYGVLLAVLVPLFDETIQIFSGRGPLISDVWIDLTGEISGVVLMSVFLVCRKALKQRRRKHNSETIM